MNFLSLDPASLKTESDVEQKFVLPVLTALTPHGLAIPISNILTKPNIRGLAIGKGTVKKIYFPDYLILVAGLPVLIVEAKTPTESLDDARHEARLYATELNALYPSGVNPCVFCVSSNGIQTQLCKSDSDQAIADFALDDANSASAAFAKFVRQACYDSLRELASQDLRKIAPNGYFRAVRLVGGTSVQDDQIPYNQFGRILSAEFQTLFNPATYADRLKIVTNAYVKSQRRERYIDEIDRIIRVSNPPSMGSVPLIEDTSKPNEIIHHLRDHGSLRNKVMLLVGDVGVGKSTFIDYLQHVALPLEIRKDTAWARLDLNDAPVNREEIYGWCKSSLASLIRETSPDLDSTTLEGLKKTYRKELEEFDLAIGALFEKDSIEYKTRLADELTKLRDDKLGTIKALERYLCTGRGRLLIVVLDNCDKRDRDEQLLMFQVAKWIQQEIRCLVVLPIRQTTYENHRHEPPLDTALKDLVYRIEPPPFQKILQERLSLVLKEANSKTKSLSYYVGDKLIEFPVEKLERFLRAMMKSLFDYEHYGRKIIIGLAGWNMRTAFELFLEFCRSGYIAEEDIFSSQVTNIPMSLSKGVVARVIMRTNYRYYDGDRSYVKNIFQCNTRDPRPDPFVRYRILSWLKRAPIQDTSSTYKGYHKVGRLISELVPLGVDESIIDLMAY